jgi:hypothetical protein
MLGTGTVLFEVRGQTQSMGHFLSERFIDAVVGGLMGMLNDVATGDVNDIDPDTFEQLPGTIEDESARALRGLDER